MKNIFFFLILALFIYSIGAVSCHLAGFCTIEQFTAQISEITKDILALFGLTMLLLGIYSEREKQ